MGGGAGGGGGCLETVFVGLAVAVLALELAVFFLFCLLVFGLLSGPRNKPQQHQNTVNVVHK